MSTLGMNGKHFLTERFSTIGTKARTLAGRIVRSGASSRRSKGGVTFLSSRLMEDAGLVADDRALIHMSYGIPLTGTLRPAANDILERKAQ